MFDHVLVVYTAWDAASTFKQLVVPACRTSGYDDVLPDPPEYSQHQQYTILRPPADGHDGDAANSFAGGLQHHGLVVQAGKQSSHTLLLPNPGGFPWHPLCEQFTRRGCSVSAAVLQEATARQQKQLQTSNQPQIQKGRQQFFRQQHRQRPSPVRLVPIALHMDAQFLQDVAAAVVQHNKTALQERIETAQQQQQGSSLQDLVERQQHLLRQTTAQQQQQPRQYQVPRVLVMPLLLQTVQAAAAAATIQSSWRAHRSRIVNRIAERALCNRAAVTIQRAWRSFLLQQRLRLLSSISTAWQAGQRLRFSSIMCVDVASRRLVDTAAEQGRTGPGMFPEQRLRFIINDDGSLLLVDMADNNSNRDGETAAAADGSVAEGSQHVVRKATTTSSSSTLAAARAGLPKWLGVDIPIVSATEAATILENQVWFEPFGRGDAGKLLELGCDMKDLLAPSLIASPGLVHPTDVAQLVTFRSPHQAAVRAALLAALTYSVKAQRSCRLLSVQDSPLGAAYRCMTGGDTAGGASGKAVSSEAGAAAGASAARVAPKAAAVGVKFKKKLKTGAGAIAGKGCEGSRAADDNTAAAAGDGGAPLTAASAAAGAVALTAAAGSAGQPTASAADSGSLTARIATKTAAVYDEQLVAEAAGAVGTAMAALKVLESGNPAPLHQLPLLPILPTKTLTAAAADTAAKTTAVGLDAGVTTVPRCVAFQTHMFYKLPYLQKLAAAVEAQAAATASAESIEANQQTAAAAAATKLEQHQANNAAAVVLTARPQTAVQLAATLAEYVRKVKQEQIEVFKVKLAEDAVAAAAAADAGLAAKQQAVQAVRAAAGTSSTGSTVQLPRSTSCTNYPAPGYWPDTTAVAAKAVQKQKQKQQQAAADATAAFRDKEKRAREDLLTQQAAATTEAQVKAQMHAHALQQLAWQEEEQQQQAASTRVALLNEIRKSCKAVAARRQQQAVALNRQCNMFSKHLKRGEVAIVHAAHLKAAAGHAAELRQTNTYAAELAQQKQEEMGSKRAAKASQERQEAKVVLLAAKGVREVELAARRAAVAAQRLLEEQMANAVGPAGGVWGSAKADEVLKTPVTVTVVGNVAGRSSSPTPEA